MRVLNILSVLFIFLSCGSGWSQVIEVKGISIGMSQDEFEKKFGSSPLRYFTIAEVPSKYEKVDFFFRDGKLDSFNFYFSEDDFDHILSVIRKKYPKLQCRNSSVSNLFGARLTQVECSIKDKLGGISLTRFVNDINTSGFTMYSNELVKELKRKNSEPSRDF